MLPVALIFVLYAIVTYVWRARLIRSRSSERWDDPFGPVFLTAILIVALTAQFLLKLYDVLFSSGGLAAPAAAPQAPPAR